MIHNMITVSKLSVIMSKSHHLPSVMDYLSYRVFLERWIVQKKKQSPHFSHRLFAKKAGYKNPSLLGLIIKGERNLTDNLLPGFMKVLELSSDEKTFFRMLVSLDRAELLTERTLIIENLLARRRFHNAFQIEEASFLYLSRWYIPVIRELAGRKDFRADPKWLVTKISPKITLSEAQQGLDLLFELGMLESADEQVIQTDKTITTPHEVASIAVRKYHQGMGSLAVQNLEKKGGKERHFGAVTALVPPQIIPRLKKEITLFQERMLHICDESTEEQTDVIQLNIQLFPLTNINKEQI
jgi:uncharacterized protein (TIGR02147 family)